MDYGSKRVFTACQLSIVHYYSRLSSFTDNNYCAKTSGNPYVVSSANPVIWDNENKFFTTDVRVATGTTLIITDCIIYMAKGTKFIVDRGARLELDGATITNGCYEFWDGIEV
jgi:hypothetical protein